MVLFASARSCRVSALFLSHFKNSGDSFGSEIYKFKFDLPINYRVVGGRVGGAFVLQD